MRLRIRNWASFQHYKDRAPPWIKLHFKILHSRDWVCASDAERVLAIACMLIASQDDANDGTFEADPDYFRRIAYLNSEPDFKSLIKRGFLELLANASISERTLDFRTTETETEREKETDKSAYALLSETSSETPKKRKPKKRTAYPEAFEAFWKAYPTDPIMSKKAAFDAWGRLSEEDRDKAGQAVPAFAKHCQANPDYRPVHAVRFLSQRRFDGFAGDSAAPQFMSDTEFQKWWKERHRSPVQ